MHSREELYRFLWSNRNSNNIVNIPQGDVAKHFGISYQRLSIVMKEFQEIGLISKNKHDFLLRYDPDRIPWGKKFDKFRSHYISSKNKDKES
jgi:hypothetical protein